jgi:hypothetical protein
VNEAANNQPGDMRFDVNGEILVFDGKNWAPYQRIPIVGPCTILRGRPHNRAQREEPADTPGKDTND